MSAEYWILTCFLAYILLILLFAGVYFRLYIINPGNYSFNSDILRQQVTISQSAAEEELTALQLRLLAYGQLLAGLRDARAQWLTKDGDIQYDTHDYHFAIAESVETLIEDQGSHRERESYRRWIILEVYNHGGDKVFSEYLDILPKYGRLNKDKTFYSDIAARRVEQIETRIKEANSRLANLSSPNPDVWRYWDFLYFSVITQTTVGYGDILPNSTQVRMIVVLQILAGLTLLTVVLNIFLQG